MVSCLILNGSHYKFLSVFFSLPSMRFFPSSVSLSSGPSVSTVYLPCTVPPCPLLVICIPTTPVLFYFPLCCLPTNMSPSASLLHLCVHEDEVPALPGPTASCPFPLSTFFASHPPELDDVPEDGRRFARVSDDLWSFITNRYGILNNREPVWRYVIGRDVGKKVRMGRKEWSDLE